MGNACGSDFSNGVICHHSPSEVATPDVPITSDEISPGPTRLGDTSYVAAAFPFSGLSTCYASKREPGVGLQLCGEHHLMIISHGGSGH